MLTEYGVDSDGIDNIVYALTNHGLTALSETGDLNLEISREILKNAL